MMTLPLSPDIPAMIAPPPARPPVRACDRRGHDLVIWTEPSQDAAAPHTDSGIYRWLTDPDRRDLAAGRMLTGCTVAVAA